MTNTAKKRKLTPIILFLSVVTLFGCEGKMQAMSNADLAAKNDECIEREPSSPGKVTACENVRKECERRRKEGNFAC